MRSHKNIKSWRKRLEFKYLLPARTADRLLPALLQFMDNDPHAAGASDQSYRVNSLYFDSPSLKNYYEKTAGIKKRKKFRLRYYGDCLTGQTPVYLEFKRKNGLIVAKDRVVYPWSLVKQFVLGQARVSDFPSEGHYLLNEFLYDQSRYSMRPKVVISYLRRPLVGRGLNNLRATFDNHLKAGKSVSVSFSPNQRRMMSGYLVLEIKCDRIIPSSIHRIIMQYGLQAVPCSKYCHGVEKTYRLN